MANINALLLFLRMMARTSMHCAIKFMFVALFANPVFAHEPPDEVQERLLMQLESLLEMESEDEQTSHADLAESLEWLIAHPVNLNRASADELRQLIMLNEMQIFNLLRHIQTHGRLISLHELQTIEGFDQETINSILPFVTIADIHPRRHFSFENLFRDGEHVLFIRYQQLLNEQKGFSVIEPEESIKNPNSRYLGSPYRLYSRYRFTWYRNISFGVTAEKDPGEEFFKGSQPYGFDFYSAHLHLQDFGRLKTLSIGDFQAQFGQGLCFWTGMGFGKSSEAIGVKKNALGLRQYTSVDENNFLRGVGATVLFGPMEVTAFFSSKKRDANILETDSAGKVLIVSSLQQTGLHRTPRELEGKNAVRETIAGANIKLNRQHMSVGLTAYGMKLDALYQRRLSFHNQFEFSNNEHWGMGLDYNYVARNFNVFGEVGMDRNARLAFLNGIMISLDRRISFALVHRHYNKAHQAPFATAFGESSRLANEKGVYAAIEVRPLPRLRLYAYADHFAFPWMRFRTYMPSQGHDYLLHLEYKPTRHIEIYGRFRTKSKPLNTRDDVMIRHLDQVERTQYRLHIAYPISPRLSMRNRLELIKHIHGNDKQKGFMLYQDVLFRSLDSPFAVTFRYALFDTGGFDSRIYAYEHDVLYAFSFPFYSDKGSRVYLLIRYRVHRQIDFYVRLAQTKFTNRNSSGSGLDEVAGNTRREIKAQLRFRF